MSASDLESGLIKVKALDGPVSSDEIQSVLKHEGINTDTGLDFESFLKVIYDIECSFKTIPKLDDKRAQQSHGRVET